MTRRLLVTASLDALYASTIVVLRIQSTEEFAVAVTGGFLRLNAGHGSGNSYASETEAPDRHVLEVELLDWVRERGVRDRHGPGAQNSYGISFYPFVSSFLQGRIEVEGEDETEVTFVLDVPDAFRPIYKQAFVRYGGTLSPEPRHAQGTDRSRFIFTPPRASASTLELDVALRFSAARLAELIAYPTAYFALSLGGIAVAASIAEPGVVIAAVGALWTFMLREWSKAKVPRRRTLLSAVYLVAGGLAAAWGALWEVTGVWGWAGVPGVLALLLAFRSARRHFDYEGVLPRYLSRFWSWRVEHSK